MVSRVSPESDGLHSEARRDHANGVEAGNDGGAARPRSRNGDRPANPLLGLSQVTPMNDRTNIGAKRWRSLAEATKKLDPDAAREFPKGVDTPDDSLHRRDLLKLLGASVMMAGAAGCERAPRGKIIPYSKQPPEVTPGVAKHYATSMTLGGYATGLLVESHEGRPTKIEGNADHPASLGATGLFEQASILSLYDPARAQGILQKGQPKSWRKLVETLTRGKGPGVSLDGTHFLLEPTSSPF